MADDHFSRESRVPSIELATLAYEIRIVVEVLSMGIHSLMDNPGAEAIRSELGVLAKLAGQGTEALVALDAALDEPVRLRA
jgi:hypothetical protein